MAMVLLATFSRSRMRRCAWKRDRYIRWGASDNNRKAKYYELTAKGRRQLEVEATAWRMLTTAVAQVLASA